LPRPPARPFRFADRPLALLRAAAAIAMLTGASAFCDAQPVAATPQVPNPSLVDPTKPLPPPVAPAPEPLPAPDPEPQPPPVPVADIALVLPLESADYRRAAEAVRDGFVAASEAASPPKRVRVIGHGDGNVLGAFEAAKSLGVRVVVGPLLRDDLRELTSSDKPLPLTLALNQLDDTVALPPRVYTLALSLESDARVLARRMRADHVNGVAVIGGDAPLTRRFVVAFASEWLLAGGGAPQSFAFEPSSDGLSTLRRELSRSSADAALIALDGPAAALARSFAPRMRAYASSLVNQAFDPATQGDLEGVVFVDLPWIVAPDDRSLARLPRKAMPNLVLERLYALGLDAFEIARRFADGVPDRLEILGATGKLSLGEGRQIVREGTFAVFRHGQATPLDGSR
jgi:outer membrane PBP1 activator LpoA protein